MMLIERWCDSHHVDIEFHNHSDASSECLISARYKVIDVIENGGIMIMLFLVVSMVMLKVVY